MNTADLQLFIRISETGSITASANQQGITTAAASSALKRLEKQLGTQLFIRTTRQLRITHAGEQFLFHCRQALHALNQGVLATKQQDGEIAGQLRLSVPSDLGRNTLLPWIDEMLVKHPLLSIDLTLADSLSDFYLDSVDAALRYGKPQDSTKVAFHIASLARITCASPQYLAVHKAPQTPSELVAHQCLIYRLNGRPFNQWHYRQGSIDHNIKVAGNRLSNDTDIIKRWALAGMGIAYRSQLDINESLQASTLIPLLEQYPSPNVELYLVCPSREQVTPAIIALRELLRKKCLSIVK